MIVVKIRSLTFLVVVVTMCFNAVVSKGYAEGDLQAGYESELTTIMSAIIKSKAGQKYFADIDSEQFKISHVPAIEGLNGWVSHWEYSKDCQMVKNPDPYAQAVNIPEVTTDNGIMFKIFIGFKNGDRMISRTKEFALSAKPRLVLAYYLKTKTKDPQLQNTIEKIVEEHWEALLRLLPPVKNS